MEEDDNRNRCRPTKELIKAENQLLHYAHQALADDLFRQRLGIMNPANIKMGGIIIGRRDRLLKGGQTSGDIERASRSLDIRKQYFYNPHNIRIFTWDRILQFLR
jgi:hypothetical protein